MSNEGELEILAEAYAVYLIWVMLLVLAASYGLCGALVLFAGWVIEPRGSETVALIGRPSESISKP